MRRNYLLICVIALFAASACGSNPVEEVSIEADYKVVRIEGCQYITYSHYAGNRGYGFMAHKGNCDNSIHNK